MCYLMYVKNLVLYVAIVIISLTFSIIYKYNKTDYIINYNYTQYLAIYNNCRYIVFAGSLKIEFSCNLNDV